MNISNRASTNITSMKLHLPSLLYTPFLNDCRSNLIRMRSIYWDRKTRSKKKIRIRKTPIETCDIQANPSWQSITATRGIKRTNTQNITLIQKWNSRKKRLVQKSPLCLRYLAYLYRSFLAFFSRLLLAKYAAISSISLMLRPSSSIISLKSSSLTSSSQSKKCSSFLTVRFFFFCSTLRSSISLAYSC